MKVGIDHQIFSFQVTGGISRYFSQLLGHSKKINDVKLCLNLRYSNNLYLKQLYADKFIPPAILRKKFKGSKWIIKLLNDLHQKRYFEVRQFDLIHPTYYQTQYLEKSVVPYVLTVHDLTHEKFPELFAGNFDFTLKYKENAILHANHLIAISENTKKDLIEFYQVDPSKVSVIYHGIPDQYETQVVHGLPPKYFLFVGERGGYKNFELLLEAFTRLNRSDVSLVCTGNDLNATELSKIASMDLENRVVQKKLNDQELNFVYENAQALVFPSLYEGFGFPIIEAMRAKCPLILANSSCFPEIAGDAARYFDPSKAKELCELMKETLEMGFKKEDYVSSGLKRFKDFKLEDSLQQTFDLYENIIKQKL